MVNALLLVATPLHVALSMQVLDCEEIDSFDVIYLAHGNLSDHQDYFERIAARSNSAHMIHAGKSGSLAGIIDVLWKIWRLKLRRDYDCAILGSLTSIPLVKIAWSNATSFITFDEGIANFNRNSRLYRDSRFWLARVYRSCLHVPPLDQIHSKIRKHYSLRPDLPNIVEQDRIARLPGWTTKGRKKPKNSSMRTYFIGTEIDTFFNPDVTRLPEFLANHKIDYYVRHPRETGDLGLGIPILEKNGLMAEEAIIRDAGEMNIGLIGWPSSVFFSLRDADSRIMLFPRNRNDLAPLAEVARIIGCKVEFI